MPTTYQARVLVNVHGASSRSFRRIEESVSRIFWANEMSSDAVIISSVKDREIKVLVAVEAGSSSSAASKLDQLLRSVAYKFEAQEHFSRGIPTPQKFKSLERELVLN